MAKESCTFEVSISHPELTVAKTAVRLSCDMMAAYTAMFSKCACLVIFLPPMQQQQAPFHHPGAAQAAAASFGGAAQHGAGGYAAEVWEAGGKATRRKGRDMERALARGDLGALGNEVRTASSVCLRGAYGLNACGWQYCVNGVGGRGTTTCHSVWVKLLMMHLTAALVRRCHYIGS